jgi:hypothetical protein
LKEGGEQAIDDAAAAEGGNTVPEAVDNNDTSDKGGVAPVVDALLQIGTEV